MSKENQSSDDQRSANKPIGANSRVTQLERRSIRANTQVAYLFICIEFHCRVGAFTSAFQMAAARTGRQTAVDKPKRNETKLN